MLAVRDERLDEVDVKFKNAASCCVVIASNGYPGSYLTGYEIDFGDSESIDGVNVFHAGTKRGDDKFFTSGGRVLAVNAVGDDAKSAREKAYDAVKRIKFEGMRYRTDIGAC
ncbi:MAG: phosphoribosylamine--glycine ligase, partial [Synergistaceae bacterium]|nr:phosphoribosylamine--glycine ligase [Synergistaceae bacterium]